MLHTIQTTKNEGAN